MPIYVDERLLAILSGVQEQCQKQGIKIQYFPKNPANIQKDDLVILPSIIASRVGSDIAVTFNTADLKGKHLLLVKCDW